MKSFRGEKQRLVVAQFADGEWHNLTELTERLGYLFPPESAMRAATDHHWNKDNPTSYNLLLGRRRLILRMVNLAGPGVELRGMDISREARMTGEALKTAQFYARYFKAPDRPKIAGEVTT